MWISLHTWAIWHLLWILCKKYTVILPAVTTLWLWRRKTVTALDLLTEKTKKLNFLFKESVIILIGYFHQLTQHLFRCAYCEIWIKNTDNYLGTSGEKPVVTARFKNIFCFKEEIKSVAIFKQYPKSFEPSKIKRMCAFHRVLLKRWKGSLCVAWTKGKDLNWAAVICNKWRRFTSASLICIAPNPCKMFSNVTLH